MLFMAKMFDADAIRQKYTISITESFGEVQVVRFMDVRKCFFSVTLLKWYTLGVGI